MEIKTDQYQGYMGNWVKARDTHPQLEGDTLTLIDDAGKTNRGTWEITSRVIVNTDTLAVVHVAYRYSGKYAGGGQYWRYYKHTGDTWTRVHWKKLDERERLAVLDAAAAMPSWVKTPGKLQADYLKPRYHGRLETDEQGAIIGYKKLLWREDLELFSSYFYPEIVWHDGELTADRVPEEGNNNGVYAAKTVDSPVLDDYQHMRGRLVKLLLSGVVVEHDYTVRAQHAVILEAL